MDTISILLIIGFLGLIIFDLTKLINGIRKEGNWNGLAQTLVMLGVFVSELLSFHNIRVIPIIVIVVLLFLSPVIENLIVKHLEGKNQMLKYGETVLKELREGKMDSFGRFTFSNGQFRKGDQIVEESKVKAYAYQYFKGEV